MLKFRIFICMTVAGTGDPCWAPVEITPMEQAPGQACNMEQQGPPKPGVVRRLEFCHNPASKNSCFESSRKKGTCTIKNKKFV